MAKHAEDPKWLDILKQYYPDRTQFNRDDTGVVQLLNSFIHDGNSIRNLSIKNLKHKNKFKAFIIKF